MWESTPVKLPSKQSDWTKLLSVTLECSGAGGAAGSGARLPNDQQRRHLVQVAQLWRAMMLNQTVARVSQGRRKVFSAALCTLVNKEILSRVHLGATHLNFILGNKLYSFKLYSWEKNHHHHLDSDVQNNELQRNNITLK